MLALMEDPNEPAEVADDSGVTLRALTVPRLLGRGIALRCPLCGGGGLFRRWFVLSARCPRCNFPLEERIEGHWLGSLGINMIVSFGILLVTTVVGAIVTYPDIRVAQVAAINVTVAIVVPLVFFPFSKTLWSAIDLAMRPLEPDDDIDPRYIPPRR